MKRNVFIDCGFHHGEGLQQFIEMLGIYDRNWLIIIFEANPACRVASRIVRESESDPEIKIFEKAVWVHDGEIAFRQENHFISQSGSPSDGTSKVDGWASQVAELNGKWPGLTPVPITVPCFDFSKFIEGFADKSKWTVYCKMDIEGSEFPVLRKILADGNAGVFEKLWVEFHERFLPGEDVRTRNDLIDELKQHTKIEQWD